MGPLTSFSKLHHSTRSALIKINAYDCALIARQAVEDAALPADTAAPVAMTG